MSNTSGMTCERSLAIYRSGQRGDKCKSTIRLDVPCRISLVHEGVRIIKSLMAAVVRLPKALFQGHIYVTSSLHSSITN